MKISIWDLRVGRRCAALQDLGYMLASCGRWERVILPIYVGKTGALRAKGAYPNTQLEHGSVMTGAWVLAFLGSPWEQSEDMNLILF